MGSSDVIKVYVGWIQEGFPASRLDLRTNPNMGCHEYKGIPQGFLHGTVFGTPYR
jgi:hypothetical protein